MATFPSGEQEPDRLTPETHEAMRRAHKHAASMHAPAVSPEHLLQGLVEQGDGSILHALGKAGIDAGAIRLRIEQLFGAYSDSDLSGDELPLSKESRECLDWAYSFAWSGSVGNRRPVAVPPLLLMLTLMRTKQVQIFLLPILPSLKSICASLLRETWRGPGRSVLSNLSTLTRETIEALPHLPDPASLYLDTPTLETSSQKLCSTCKKGIPGNWKHCAYCGTSLTQTCPKCGTPRPDIEDARFCFECGNQLD